METETLFFKDKVIQGRNVEIVFHKDVTYIFNAETFPIVKYTLFNCEDLASKNFEGIDFYNDGVFVEIKKDGSNTVFETTDMGGQVFQIVCQKFKKESLEYRKQDYIDLIRELMKQRDNEYEMSKKHHHHFENIKTFLQKEIDINERKIGQADWLTPDKRKFFEGELNAFRKVLELMT